MPGFLLLVFFLALAAAGAYALAYTDVRKLMRWGRYLGPLLMLGGAAGLAVVGRWTLALPLAVFAASMLLRGGMSGAGWPGMGGTRKSAGQASRVRARFLEMTLDHDSGEMNGSIREGAQAGADLADLDEDELKALAKEIAGDPESTALLEAWLDRYHPDWQDWADMTQRKTGGGASGAGGAMSAEEAREILGVGAGADARQIRAAHRRLMKGLHPDQGGSTYLAAKLNEARDLLLKLV
ncbi:MAG TPA: molecular chaperone DnaJ [Hyphomicrobiales bacterium]|nr:molecular chaperone DnaJ [Rhodobiaceae bacterium]HXK54085.1 molecular chaperone DnaJ [Hyphomicrobiales bacterium]